MSKFYFSPALAPIVVIKSMGMCKVVKTLGLTFFPWD